MNLKRVVTGAALTLGLVLGGGTAAVVGGVHLYSDYFHQTRCHGSSTRNDWGLSSSPNVAGGVWANNSQPTTAVQNNRAYYRVC